MAEERSRVYFVASLTLRGWLGFIFPRLLRQRRLGGLTETHCHIFEASRAGWWVARATSWMAGTSVHRFRYRLADVRLLGGELAWLTGQYQDQGDLERAIWQRWEMPNAAGLLEMFVRKQVSEALYRPLIMVRVAAWKTHGGRAAEAVLFLTPDVGGEELATFGAAAGVRVITMPAWLEVEVIGSLRRVGRAILKWALVRMRQVVDSKERAGYLTTGQRESKIVDCERNPSRDNQAKLGVTYVGRLNLSDLGKYSDLFFWQMSSLQAKDVVVLFAYHQDPLDEEKLVQLEERGFNTIVVNPAAASTARSSVYRPPFRVRLDYKVVAEVLSERASAGAEKAWLKQQEVNYHKLKDYQIDLFKTANIKLFVSYHKYDGNHAAIADALEELGGILALYQRSFESDPAAALAVATDVFFGWSRFGAEVERQSGSVIRHYVITGYVGDHRKPYILRRAHELRGRLMASGARKILAFFDENSTDDPRWHPDHEYFRVDYQFLLERILNDPSVGVIFKSKNPMTVRKRLGPVADMLELAEKTGRCVLLGLGQLQSTTTPLEAGLASDVAVGSLYSGTPSLECALGGVPSLLLDREGFRRSPLYKLGVGKVVFQDWDTLWHACEEHWKFPGGIPGFGDWSPMLNELDPFRDGRAAERMGNYLKWLIEGLKSGLDREAVMAEAAERYCSVWGKDKVTEVNGQSWHLTPSALDGRQGSANPAKDRKSVVTNVSALAPRVL